MQLGIQIDAHDITNGLNVSDGTSYDYILLLDIFEHAAYSHRIINKAINHAKNDVMVIIGNRVCVIWRINFKRIGTQTILYTAALLVSKRF